MSDEHSRRVVLPDEERMLPFDRHLTSINALNPSDDELEVHAGMNYITCGQYALLEGGGGELHRGPVVFIKGQGC